MTVVSSTHYLEINSVPLSTFGWEILDLGPLLSMPEIRGSNRLIPGKSGMAPYLRRATETRYVFTTLWVYGHVDEDNVAYGDPFEGLLTNVQYLRDNIALPKSTGDGTYTANWYRPGSLDDLTTDCHVTAFDMTRSSATSAQFTLEISVPSGTWTAIP